MGSDTPNSPTEFCTNFFSDYAVARYARGGQIGIFMIISGLMYFLTSGIILYWIKRQQWYAMQGDQEAVKAVIFPLYVKVLWLNFFANMMFGVVIITMEPPSDHSLPPGTAIIYGLTWGVQHFVIEGVAFLLMQKGLGNYAAKTAAEYAAAWALFTTLVEYTSFEAKRRANSIILDTVWQLLLLFFYMALWMCPQRFLYRRPAALLYAQIWGFYRIFTITTSVLRAFPETVAVGDCASGFIRFIIFSVVQPWVTYTTLLRDSRCAL